MGEIRNQISGGVFRGTVIQSRNVTVQLPERAAPLLGGLPNASPIFAGREADLSGLLRRLDPRRRAADPTHVCVVTGPAGVGKSELLLHAAHAALRQEWFPDGLLFIDLQGYTAGLSPLSPNDVLGRFLHRLGMPTAAVPGHVEDRAAAYREYLDGRSVLVVLDNARDSDQVRPLLPPARGCAAVVSSRQRLPALDDVSRLALGILPPDAAVKLFLSAAVPGAATKSTLMRSHVRRIVAQCGGLPLALRIAAARVRGEPTGRFAELAEWLADERERLVEIDDGERNVTAAFRVSYDRLTDAQRRLFSLCGLHPRPRLGVHAAAALADLPLRATRRVLYELRNAHLVAEDGSGYYRLHDLLHTYARTRVNEEVSERDRRAAIDRLIDYYLHTAHCADLAVAPYRYRLPCELRHLPRTIPDVAERPAALAWFSAELQNLTAVCQAASETEDSARCWLLADAMRGFFFLTKTWNPWLETHRVALVTANRAGEQRAQGILHNSIGIALIEQGESKTAARHYRTAEQLFRQAGDLHGVATSVENRAWVHQYAGDFPAALADHQYALGIYQRLGARRNWAITLRGIALTELELDRTAHAVPHLMEAWEIFRDLGLDLDAAMALNCLGEAHARSGDLGAARLYHLRALRLSRACGSTFEEARARNGLGTATAARNPRLARHHWERALRHYTTLRSPAAKQVHAQLEQLERHL